MSTRHDEKAFTPDFLARCTNLELVALQHELRKSPDDKPYLDQVLEVIKRRAEDRE